MAECAARFRSRANADSIGALLLHPGTENERQAALRRKGRPARDHARENVLAIRRAEKENRQRKGGGRERREEALQDEAI